MPAGRCKCAYPTDEYHGYGCEITGGECTFLHPDSKRCAEEYGEGPDAQDYESDDSLEKLNTWLDEHDGEDFCQYCDYECEHSGVKSSPDGPIYPPCADWDEEETLEHLDTDAILRDLKEDN